MRLHHVQLAIPAGGGTQATHCSWVEVDLHTGLVRVLRHLVGEDCGAMGNPTNGEGQIAGGTGQGVGGALLEELDFWPVISGDHNDDPAWSLWTEDLRQRAHINQFKKPLRAVDDGGDPAGFVIVKSMLLTGFDAPVAQVLYLDRSLREAELLQAIARVNRTFTGKDYGLVVDYPGIARRVG